MRIEGSDNFGICSSVMKFFIILIICSGSIICATGEEACVDKLPDCASYTTRSCKPPYVQWAYKNCPSSCGFCRKPCIDNLGDCEEYGKAACAPPYEKWARQNCAKYCGYCGPDIDCAYGVWMNLSSCSESTSDSEWYVQVRSITPESNDEDDSPRNCDETLIRYNSCKDSQVTQQSDLNYIGEHLDIRLAVVDNLKHNGLKHKLSLVLTNTGNKTIKPGDWSIYFYSFLMIEPEHLPKAKEYILPHYNLKLMHIKGSLFSITPTNGFPNLRYNQSHYSEFFTQYWSVTKTDGMSNWYVAAPSFEAVNIASTAFGKKFIDNFTSVRQWKRTRADRYNPFTAQARYRRYTIQDFEKAIKLVIPTPKLVNRNSDGFLSVINLSVSYESLLKETASFLSEKLNSTLKVLGNATKRRHNTIQLSVNPTISNKSEAYYIDVQISNKSINIIGQSSSAVYYGVQSLLSLVAGSPDNASVPDVYIEDEPRYEFRGMHVDVARNFRPKSDIIRLMDGMAMYKMNKLHLHLSDDEGWRIEIPGLPELTEVSGKRCHDLTERKCLVPQLGSGADTSTSGSGYYTVSDYKDIIKEAQRRHIEVIPEIDTPGHFRAAIKAMEARFLKYEKENITAAKEYRLVESGDSSKYSSVQMFNDNALNPCIDSTYVFYEKVLTEIKKMHVGLTFFHFGGDEVANGVWLNSTKCRHLANSRNFTEPISVHLKKYYVHRVANISHRLGLNLAGWEDGFVDEKGIPYNRMSLPNKEVYTNAWQNIWEWGSAKRAYILANNDYKVVMSQATHLYFDSPPEPDPEEPGLYWASRFIDTMKTFQFLPDRLYENIDANRFGEPLTNTDVCGQRNEQCPALIKRNNIIGIQGHIWSETIMTSGIFDYMLFPRILSVAERAWHKASWEDLNTPERTQTSFADWEEFANTIAYKELDRLQSLGIKYRIPLPGAIKINGTFHANTEFPGHIVQYSYDEGVTWFDVFDGFHPKRNTILLRSSTQNRERVSRPIPFNLDEPVPLSVQHQVDYLAENIVISYNVVSNIETNQTFTANVTIINKGKEDIFYGNWEIYFFSTHLIQPDSYPYPKGYLLPNCDMKVFHVAGSLFKLKPERLFHLSNKNGVTCTLKAQGYQVARSDSMPNWYVAAEGMQAKEILFTRNETLLFVGPLNQPEQYLRFQGDVLSPFTPEERFQINDATNVKDTEPKHVIPTPVHIHFNNRSIIIDDTWVMHVSTDFPNESMLIADLLNISTSLRKTSIKFIELQKLSHVHILDNNRTKNEAYEINASPHAITISAQTSKGAFYAYKTLAFLKETRNGSNLLPVFTTRDQPRFPYRGLHLDVSRNFQPKKEIYKLIEVMSMYKLNTFHFHLTDDEGWRLEIPGIPELTAVGSTRCHDSQEEECIVPQLGSGASKTAYGSGYYTINDYKDILRYANDRHIRVIPEISLPIHTRAAKRAMEVRYRKYMNYGNKSSAHQFLLTDFEDKTEYLTMQMFKDNAINICMNSTYEFIRHVVRSIKDMHVDIQPLRTLHIGGDGMADVWSNSSDCQTQKIVNGVNDTHHLRQYFVSKVSKILDDEGLSMAVFEDVLSNENTLLNVTEISPKRDVMVLNWNNICEWGNGESAYKLANAGYNVVIGHATHLYLDHTHEPDPKERGASWASRYIDTRKIFGFVPSNIYYNPDQDSNNKPFTQIDICPSNGICTTLKRPENIIGMQAQVWTEAMRTVEELHEMIFPRLLGVAERAWHQALWEKTEDKVERIRKTNEEWTSFSAALTKEFMRLDKMGVMYRLPPPGARLINGAVRVNTAFPGMHVEFSLDNEQTWSVVTTDMIIVGKEDVHFRTRSADGSRFSRVVTIKGN